MGLILFHLLIIRCRKEGNMLNGSAEFLGNVFIEVFFRNMIIDVSWVHRFHLGGGFAKTCIL